MAKAKRPQKATEAPRKPDAATGKRKEKNTSGTAADESGENRSLLESAQQTLLLSESLRGINRSEQSNADLRERMKRMETALPTPPLISPAATETTPSKPSPAPTIAGRTSLELIGGWREQLWIDENSQTQPLRLPRATIIGRCLCELVLTLPEDKSEIVAILEFLATTAGHHVGSEVTDNVKLYRVSPVKKVRDNANSSLSQRFNKRLDWLVSKKTAHRREGGRWVSDRGREIFDRWPDWQVRDDAGWECFGRYVPVASTSHP